MNSVWLFALAAFMGGVAGLALGRKSLSGRLERLTQVIAQKDYEFGQLKAQSEDAMSKQRSKSIDLQTRVQKHESQHEKLKTELRAVHDQLDSLATENRNLRDFCTSTLDKLRAESALLPSAVNWAIRLQETIDEKAVSRLLSPPHPAPSAAVQVREAKAAARTWQQTAELLRNRLSLYESQAPWLAEYGEYTVDEILAGLNEQAEMRRTYAVGDDPVKLFVAPGEWDRLSSTNRNQLALDRYWEASRRRTAWTAGIQYERYIGHLYETQGYDVEYRGAVEGKHDLGIDLVCTKGKSVHIVQCKRLSVHKELPVRENVVAQIYGAAKFFALSSNIDPSTVKPTIVTTYELSGDAKRFAQMLGVAMREYCAFEPYPCIKCNISERTGERIYHLPFDQQYDTTKVGNVDGEFYAMTVAEAEGAKFRRAFKWRGE